MDRVGTHAQLNQHYRFLVCELWKIPEPELQVAHSFNKYSNHFIGTSDAVAGKHGLTALNALYNPVHDDVEAALYVMTLHRFMNVWAVVRWTLRLMQSVDSIYMVTHLGTNLRAAVSELSSSPRLIHGFPAFVQTFLFVWGGFLVESRRALEVEQLARETASTPDAVELYLRVFDRIYSGPGSSMMGSGLGLTYFKYMPAACRALGARHRRAIEPAVYGSYPFFGRLGARYDAALDRALAAIGGVSALKY